MGQGNTKSGVIGWGLSDFGQLGSVSSSSSSQKSRSPKLLEVLARSAQSAVSVAAAGSFSLVVLDNGEIVVFGKGDCGQLGLGVGESCTPVPRLIRGSLHGKFVKQIACSDFHCAAITDSGSLFTWGRGQHGRLGHGLIEDEPAPRLVEGLVGSPVSMVSCGEYHTLAAFGSGLFAFGLGLSGRLGTGNETDQSEPTLIGGPLSGKTLVAISAGGHHSAAIVSPGVLYTWGGSSFGKLGHGSSVSCCLVPKLVAGLSHTRLVQVSLGQHHSAALAVNGDVYVWGKSQGLKCEDLWSPEKVADLPPISSVLCGRKGAVFAITSAGDVYIRGPMSGDLQWMTVGFSPAADTTGESNRQQVYVLSGKGVVGLAIGEQHCIGMADPSRSMSSPPLPTEDPTEGSTCAPSPEPVVNRPSLYHVLETVVRSVPPPPPKPSLEGELEFVSNELKFVQIQNHKLTAKLEEAFTRIAHLERENTSLREELDASLHCLPVGANPMDTSSTSVHLVECETVSPEL